MLVTVFQIYVLCCSFSIKKFYFNKKNLKSCNIRNVGVFQ